MPTENARHARRSRLVLLLFTAMWCVLLAGLDVFLGGRLVTQIASGDRYLPVEATVVESGMTSRRYRGGRSGPARTYAPGVVYEYEVAGEVHRSDVIHLFVWRSSDGREAQAISERYPAGSAITAHHDPDDPSVAMLYPGASSVPAFMVLFLLPFHCAAIGLVLGVFAMRPRGYVHPSLNEAIAQDDGTVAELRSHSMPVWGACFATLGIATFLSMFVVLVAQGASTGWPMVLSCVGAAGALAVIAGAVAWRLKPAPVVLDRSARTIERKGSVCSFDEIVGFEVVARDRAFRGDSGFRWYTVLAKRAGSEPVELVRQMGLDGHADPLVDWLDEQVRQRGSDSSGGTA